MLEGRSRFASGTSHPSVECLLVWEEENTSTGSGVVETRAEFSNLLRDDEVVLLYLVIREAQLAAHSEAPAVHSAVFLQNHCVLLPTCYANHLVHGRPLFNLVLPEVEADFVGDNLAERLWASLDCTRRLGVSLSRQDLIVVLRVEVLPLAEFFGSAAQTKLELVVFASGEQLFELHVETVALDFHHQLVVLQGVTRSRVDQLVLLVRVDDLRDAHVCDSDRCAHVAIV